MSGNYRDIRTLFRVAADALQARTLTNCPSKWAPLNLRFPADSPFPGPYREDTYPPARGILDAMGIMNSAREIVICGPAQTGKTTAVQAFLGQLVDEMPCRIQVVVPDDKSVQKWQESKLESLWAVVSSLAHMAEKSHERVHKVGMVQLPGKVGQIIVAAAGTKQTWRQESIRILIADDVDAWKATGDSGGVKVDPWQLARSRVTLFQSGGSKIVFISTPSTPDGTIWTSLLDSSHREFWVPCPHCGGYQVPHPVNWRYDPGQPASIRLVCLHCAGPIYQHQLPPMLRAGEWRARRPELVGIREGFHLTQCLSPPQFASWTQYAREHEAAQQALERGDPTLMQGVVNTRQGLPYAPVNDKRLTELSRACIDKAAAQAPFTASELVNAKLWTLGVDVQRDRLELMRAGWGKGMEGWMVEYTIITGRYDDQTTWDELLAWILARNPRVQGVCVDVSFMRVDKDPSSVTTLMMVQTMFLALARAGIHLWAVKGRASKTSPIWPQTPIRPGNLRAGNDMSPVIVGVDRAKNWLRSALTTDKVSGPDTLHIDSTMPKDVIRQLFSERHWRKGDKGGPSTTTWVKVHGKVRQEGLDTAVYNVCALHALRSLPDGYGVQMSRWMDGPVKPPVPRTQRTTAKPRRRMQYLDDGNPF